MAAAVAEPGGDFGAVLGQPAQQLVRDFAAFLLASAQPLVGAGVLHLPLDLVELADQLERLSGNLAFVGRMQLEELAPRMRPAARLAAVITHELLVAGKVIDQQCAAPALQELAGVNVFSLLPANQAVAFAKMSRSIWTWRSLRRSSMSSWRSWAFGAAMLAGNAVAPMPPAWRTQLRMLVWQPNSLDKSLGLRLLRTSSTIWSRKACA